MAVGSGCWPVLVDESVAGSGSLDSVVWSDRGDVAGVVRGSLPDSSMWPLGVVVLDIFAEQLSELGLVPDDGSVQEFVAQRADPSFCVRVCLRRPRWDPNGGDGGPCEDVVEGAGELSGSITDHEPKPMTIAEAHAEVSDGLGRPRVRGVRGDPEQVDASGGVFDDEQNMKSSEQRGVDASEVGGDDCFGL